MPLVPAKCTQCGASLTVDPSQDAAVCPFCKTPFIVEKAINNYYVTNVTNQTITADVVNVESSDSADNQCRTAETCLQFGEWEKAEAAFTRITEQFSFDFRGWHGRIRARTQNYQTQNLTYDELAILMDLYEHMKKVSDENLPERIEVRDYLKNYCRVLPEYLRQNMRQEKEATSAEQSMMRTKMANSPMPAEEEWKDKKDLLPLKIWKIWKVLSAVFLVVYLIALIAAWIREPWFPDVNLSLGFFSIEGPDYIWDALLYALVILQWIHLVVSVFICFTGIRSRLRQKKGRYARYNPLSELLRYAAISLGVQAGYALVACFAVSFQDPGYFFSYTGSYRYLRFLLFSAKLTETGAVWCGFFILLILHILNFLIMAAPLLHMSREGKKKENYAEAKALYCTLELGIKVMDGKRTDIENRYQTMIDQVNLWLKQLEK